MGYSGPEIVRISGPFLFIQVQVEVDHMQSMEVKKFNQHRRGEI
jgi:hypothetical protein